MQQLLIGARRSIALLALIVFAIMPLAQRRDGPQVTASLTSGVAKVGEDLAISLVVEGSHDAQVVAIPEVEGLTIGAARAGRQMTNIVNGRRWVSISWVIPVRADREGTFEIPPITVEVGGELVETRPLSLQAAPDLAGSELGYLEVRATPAKVVEGQPFTIELLFGWDEATNTNYAALALPWWNALPGTLELDPPSTIPDARAVNLVINNRHEVAVEELRAEIRDGRTYRSFRLLKHILPARSGELSFSTSFLEFGRKRVNRSFFNDRTEILDQYFVDADPFLLEVVPLPTEGQPLDFSGAVGQVTAKATADTRDVIVGDSIKLTVDWTGAGNLEFFDTPDPALLDDFAPFRVYGKTEEKRFERRRTVYDLAPVEEGIEQIPSLPLSVFDPERGEYLTVRTDPIPIRVRPLPAGVDLAGEGEGNRVVHDIRDIDASPFPGAEPNGASRLSDRTVGAWALALPLLLLAGRIVVRRRRGDPNAPRERRRRRARRRLAKGLARAGSTRDRLDLFLDFLADRTRAEREAWAGRRVTDGGRWPGRGITTLSKEGAHAIDRLLDRLERGVWGDGDESVERREILETADRAMKEGL